VLFISILTGCGGDSTGPGTSLVEENGLTRDINAMVPSQLLATIEALGMPIHRGGSPPSIEGVFHITPFVLVDSNRPGDTPGDRYADYYVEFSDQSNANLTITTDYVNAEEVGVGLGSFIVGQGGQFSVFTELTVEINGEAASVLAVYSGRMGQSSVENMHAAGFMLDNNGNPSGYFIDDGQGRVFRDQDGASLRITALPAALGVMADGFTSGGFVHSP